MDTEALGQKPIVSRHLRGQKHFSQESVVIH
jgi:hypothetical protein